MKTAISLPDRVFREADRHARRTGKSRSQLYAEALAEYLARHAPDAVTDAMNQVCDSVWHEIRPLPPRRRQTPPEERTVVITQGDIWWADLAEPAGAEPGYRRPVVVVQSNAFNRSRIATAVCVPLTSNLKWSDAPGNVLLPARSTGLAKDSVANVSQIITLNKAILTQRSRQTLPQIPATHLPGHRSCPGKIAH